MRVRPPAADFRCPEPERGTKIDRARDLGAGFLAHQIGKPSRQLALLRLRKRREQHVGDREPEHVVAQKFEPLVAAGAALPLERGDVRQARSSRSASEKR